MRKKVDPSNIDTQDIGQDIYIALSLLILMVIALVLSPMLNSGFISDDSWSSTLSSYPNLRTMLAATYEQILTQLKFHGHLGILSTLLGNAVYFFTQHDVLLYKIFILAMIVINIGLFEHFINRLSLSRILGLMSIISLPLLFQFRNYHDPILSFAGQQQLILTTLLISLLFLLDYFDTGKKSKFWLSVLFYFLCLQVYENTYSFFLFHLLVIFLKAERKDFIKLSLPFVVLPVLLATILVGFKHYHPSTYPGTAVSFDIFRIFQTFLKQISAAFPFSYVLFFINKTISYDRYSIYHHDIPHLLLLVFSSTTFVYYFCKTALIGDRVFPVKYILFFGLLFLLVPGMIISLSQKYQEELTWGIGYLPVYISYFGTSLLIAVLLSFVLKHVVGKKMLGYTIGLFLGLLFCSAIAINYVNNRIVVDNLNYTFLYSRGIIEEAAKNGLFKPVENSSLLYINGNHHWDGYYAQTQREFYQLLAPGKFADVVTLKDIENYVPLNISTSTYYLNYTSISRETGYAVVGRLAAPVKSFSMQSKEIFVYVRVPYYKPIAWDWNVFSPKISFLGKWSYPGEDSLGFILNDYDSTVEIVESGIDWRLYKVVSEKLIDLKSLIINVDRQYVPISDYIELNKTTDFREMQYFSKGWSNPESTLRWSEGKEAVMTFRMKNDRDLARNTYSLTLNASSNGNQRVIVLINDRKIGEVKFVGTFDTKKINFNASILRDNEEANVITLKIPNAHAPGNGDPRLLGIYIVSFVIGDQD